MCISGRPWLLRRPWCRKHSSLHKGVRRPMHSLPLLRKKSKLGKRSKRLMKGRAYRAGRARRCADAITWTGSRKSSVDVPTLLMALATDTARLLWESGQGTNGARRSSLQEPLTQAHAAYHTRKCVIWEEWSATESRLNVQG